MYKELGVHLLIVPLVPVIIKMLITAGGVIILENPGPVFLLGFFSVRASSCIPHWTIIIYKS